MPEHLSKQYRVIFNFIDADKNGSISSSELMPLLAMMLTPHQYLHRSSQTAVMTRYRGPNLKRPFGITSRASSTTKAAVKMSTRLTKGGT